MLEPDLNVNQTAPAGQSGPQSLSAEVISRERWRRLDRIRSRPTGVMTHALSHGEQPRPGTGRTGQRAGAPPAEPGKQRRRAGRPSDPPEQLEKLDRQHDRKTGRHEVDGRQHGSAQDAEQLEQLNRREHQLADRQAGHVACFERQ